MSDELAKMTPNQRRALSKGLAALETMADLWASEVRLTDISERISAVLDDGDRAKRIAALIHLGFVEGAYRHFLDHKEKCEALESQAQTIERLTRELDAARKDAERYRWLRDASMCQWEFPFVTEQHRMPEKMVYIGPLTGHALDTAIDAAIAATGKHLMERVDYIDEQGYAHMKVPK